MKKKILISILCGIMVMGLTGCEDTTTNETNKENSSQTSNTDKNVTNGTISCISPYGSDTKTETEDTTIENGVAIKHIITEVNTYSNAEDYKKECESAKGYENPTWEYYENDKVTCDDSTKTITHTKTYIIDENLDEVYNIKKYKKENGSFDSKGYIEELEEYDYACSIK